MTVGWYIDEWSQEERDDDEAVAVCATALCLVSLGMQTPEAWATQIETALRNTRPGRAEYLRARILDDGILDQAESRALHILDWLYRHEHPQS